MCKRLLLATKVYKSINEYKMVFKLLIEYKNILNDLNRFQEI